MLIKQLIKKP